jgi:environmental stress-induced protein Ves
LTLILKASSYREGRWRNGLGVSWEIAGDGGDDFTWRMALARLDADVPFSAYPGIDRVFTIIEGEGVDLDVDGLATIAARYLRPVHFPGDRATTSHLVAGPSRALNLFVKRHAYSSDVSVTRHDKGDELRVPPLSLIFIIDGLASTDGDELESGDSVVVDSPAMIRCHVASTLWHATLSAANTV